MRTRRGRPRAPPASSAVMPTRLSAAGTPRTRRSASRRRTSGSPAASRTRRGPQAESSPCSQGALTAVRSSSTPAHRGGRVIGALARDPRRAGPPLRPLLIASYRTPRSASRRSPDSDSPGHASVHSSRTSSTAASCERCTSVVAVEIFRQLGRGMTYRLRLSTHRRPATPTKHALDRRASRSAAEPLPGCEPSEAPEAGASRARWRCLTRRPQCGTRRRPDPYRARGIPYRSGPTPAPSAWRL